MTYVIKVANIYKYFDFLIDKNEVYK